MVNGKKIGVAVIKRKVTSFEYRDVAIIELDKPTASGFTLALVNDFGDPVGFLSRDEEGKFLIESLNTSGEIDGFYND